MKKLADPACGSNTPPSEWSAPRIADAHAYLDTIGMFIWYLPKGLRKAVEATLCGAVIIKPCKDRNGAACGWQLTVHQPNDLTLRIIDGFKKQHRGTLNRFDIAVDLIPAVPAELEALGLWLERHALMKWRTPGPMHRDWETVYWIWQKGRKRRSSRDLALYTDKASKLTGEVDCAHFEMRFLNADSVRRTGCSSLKDMLELDPASLFQKYIKLLEFDAEQYKLKMIRQTVREERLRRRSNNPHPMMDLYRTSLPKRVRSILERGQIDNVQRFRDVEPKRFAKLKVLSLDILNLPNELSLIPARKGRH